MAAGSEMLQRCGLLGERARQAAALRAARCALLRLRGCTDGRRGLGGRCQPGARRVIALGHRARLSLPGWHRPRVVAPVPRRAPNPSRVCSSRARSATVLPLPRPRHKPLRDRAVYQALALSAGSAMAAARTTFATTGVGREMESPPPPPAPVIQPVAAEVPAVSSLETERKRGGRELEEGRGRRERIVEEEEEGAREAAPKVHSFVLAYTLLLALTALGLTIAGGATNYWVSVRAGCAQRTAATRRPTAATT